MIKVNESYTGSCVTYNGSQKHGNMDNEQTMWDKTWSFSTVATLTNTMEYPDREKNDRCLENTWSDEIIFLRKSISANKCGKYIQKHGHWINNEFFSCGYVGK